MKIKETQTQAHDITILFDGNFSEFLDYLNDKGINHQAVCVGLRNSGNVLAIEKDNKPIDPNDDDDNYCGAW